MTDKDSRPQSTVWDAEWEEILTAADSAGRHAARELARRCSAWELGRTGRVYIHVGPLDSPLAGWLRLCGHATTEGGTVRVEVTLNTAEFACEVSSTLKTQSLLVRRAYAAAYCTVLTEEAGAIAKEEIVPDRNMPRQRSTLTTVPRLERTPISKPESDNLLGTQSIPEQS